MSNEPVLDVRDLHVSIPLRGSMLRVVRGIDFSINHGETLCIVGESGCGKSQTALALMGLLAPGLERKAERIALDGQDLSRLSQRQLASVRGRDVAMIFQDPMTSLNPTLSIERQMTEGVRRHEKLTAVQARHRAIEMLERVGIGRAAERLSQYPHQFSGGQRQRIMIAMVLMGKPKLLIADEPTTALDVTIQAQILAILNGLKEEFGLALLLITHDLGVVASIADRVCVMYAGRIVESGSAIKVFQTPSHPYTRGLLAAIPIPGRTPPGARLPAIPGRVPNLLGSVEGCAFRPRCSMAKDACAVSPLPVHETDDHRIECILGIESERKVA